jgi:GNAT superfamily N-acetyltransferase
MKESIVTRRGVIEDLEAVRACVVEAYRPYIAVIGQEPAAIRTDFAPYLERGQVVVATLDGALVGLVVVLDEQDCVEIRSMAILPALQRRGIGSLLMARAEEQARALGRKTMRLYTNARLPNLVRMYARMGFVERERKHDGGFDRVFMSMEVS